MEPGGAGWSRNGELDPADRLMRLETTPHSTLRCCFHTLTLTSEIGDFLMVVPLRRAIARPSHAAVGVVPRVQLLPTTVEDTVIELSERLRSAGAAALLLRNPSLRQVQLVLEEQRSAAGNFPSPVPVLCEDLQWGTGAHEAAPDGAAALVLAHDEAVSGAPSGWPHIVPRCDSAADLEATLALQTPPLLVFASEAAVPSLPSMAATLTGACGNDATLVMASLELGPGCAAEARELRAAGCSAVVVEFAADDWPAPPEAVVRAVLSTHSTTYNSLGLKVGYGDFSSDQYWLNRKFKEARSNQKRRYAKEGPPAGDSGGTPDAPAGSQVGLS